MIRQLSRTATLAALPMALACSQTQRAAADSADSAGGDSLRPAPAEAPAAADTLRGIVVEVGSVPVTSIVIRPQGERPVTITGTLEPEIARAVGAEVWASGRRTAEGMEVERYAVRSVDGQGAIDGTLVAEGGALFIETSAGRRRIARPPQALRGMTGARVWLVGEPEGSITSYGVLRAAP